MAIKSVGFRLQTDGKAEVKNDFAEVKKAGQDAMDGVATAAEQAAARASEATSAFTARQEAAFRKAANAAKMAAAGADTRTSFDQALAQPGNAGQFATVNLDRTSGAAKASASAFEEAFAAQKLAAEADEKRASSLVKLRAALDPISVAQARYGQEVAEVEALHKASAITDEERAAALKLYAGRLDDTRRALDGSAKADADAEAAAQRLRAALDPLGVAQKRYNDEIASYKSLLDKGKITENEHAAAVELSTRELDGARKALDGHSESVGFNRTQLIMLRSAAFNASSSIAAGMPLYRVLIEQGLEVGQALAMGDGSMAKAFDKAGDASKSSADDIKDGSDKSSGALDDLKDKAKESADSLVGEHGVSGALTKLRSLVSPTTLALGAAAIAVAVGTKAWLDYSNAVLKFNAIAMGAGATLGLTGSGLESVAEQAAHAGKMTTAAAREIETAYVQSGNATKEVLASLIAATKDFAAATGEEVPAATGKLDAAMADPIKGAQDLAERYGWVSQATADYIAKLVEENDTAAAQRVLIDAVTNATSGAAEQVNILSRAWTGVGDAAAGAFNWIGKAIDRMATGGSLQDRLGDLLRARATAAPSVGQMLMGATTDSVRADLDRQIAAVRYQMRQETALADRRAANADQAKASAVVGRYTGADRLDGYRTQAGLLRAGLATDMPPAQRAEMTSALAAYTHAIDTFVPAQEKANQVQAAEARLAAAKTPAAKAQAASALALVQAQGEVVTAADAASRAHARGEAAAARATKTGDKHAQTLAREAASMEVSARAALDVADAYLKSSAAGLQAEARRKAATDATKKGIDVDAQARRELNLQVSEGVATGAKAVAGLRDETVERDSIRAKVEAGTVAVGDMARALSDETALRPLLKLQTIAQGDALTALNRVIAEYRAGLDSAHQSEDRFALTQALQESINKVEELKASVTDLAHTPLDAALNAANRAAGLAADSLHLRGDDRTKYVRQKEDEALQGYLAARERYSFDALRDQRDNLTLSQRELELAGANDNIRTVELDKLRRALDIRRQFPDMAQADVDRIMSGIAAQDAMNVRLKIASSAWDEIRGAGGQFVDTVLSADTWSSWGNAGKTILKEIESEFIKLALINPLKNLINGNSALPTIGSAIGALLGGGSNLASSVSAGGAAASASNSARLAGQIGFNASGTENWSGGATWVGENGPEIVNLPSGARVTSAAASRQMLQAANDPARMHVSIGFDDEMLTARIVAVSDSRIAASAPRIAYGASQLTEARATKRARRVIRR